MDWFELVLDFILWFSVVVEELWISFIHRINKFTHTCFRLFWTFCDNSEILSNQSNRLNQFKLNSPLFQHWSRWSTNLPEFANRLRSGWQHAPAQLQMLRSHLLFDKLLKVTWILQRHCSNECAKLHIILIKIRLNVSRSVRLATLQLKQPHTQELPLFVIGSFIVFNCFAVGYWTLGILSFLLLGNSLQWLGQRKHKTLMNRLLHRSHQSDQYRKLMIYKLQTNNDFVDYCDEELWWANEFLAKLWAPFFVQPIQKQIDLNLENGRNVGALPETAHDSLSRKLSGLFNESDTLRFTNLKLNSGRPPLISLIQTIESARSDEVAFQISFRFCLDLYIYDVKRDERKSLQEILFDAIGHVIFPCTSTHMFSQFVFYCLEPPTAAEQVPFQQLFPFHSISQLNQLLNRYFRHCLVFPSKLPCTPIDIDSTKVSSSSLIVSDSLPLAICSVQLLQAVNLTTFSVQHPSYVCKLKIGMQNFQTRTQRSSNGNPRFDQNFAAYIHDLYEPLYVEVLLKESEEQSRSLGKIVFNLHAIFPQCHCETNVELCNKLVKKPLSSIVTKSQLLSVEHGFGPVCRQCDRPCNASIDFPLNFRSFWLPFEACESHAKDHGSSISNIDNNSSEIRNTANLHKNGFLQLRVGIQLLSTDSKQFHKTLNQLQNLQLNNSPNVCNLLSSNVFPVPILLLSIDLQRLCLEIDHHFIRMAEFEINGQLSVQITYGENTQMLITRRDTKSLLTAVSSERQSTHRIIVPVVGQSQFICYQLEPKKQIKFQLQLYKHLSKSKPYTLGTGWLQLSYPPMFDEDQFDKNVCTLSPSFATILDAKTTFGAEVKWKEIVFTSNDRSGNYRQRNVATALVKLQLQFADLSADALMNLLSEQQVSQLKSSKTERQTTKTFRSLHSVCELIRTHFVQHPKIDLTNAFIPGTTKPSTTILCSIDKEEKSLLTKKTHQEIVKQKRQESNCNVLIAFNQFQRGRLAVDVVRLINVPVFETNQIPCVRISMQLWAGCDRISQMSTDRLMPSRDPHVGIRYEFELPAQLSGRLILKVLVEQPTSWTVLGWMCSWWMPTEHLLAEGFIQVPLLEVGGHAPPEWFNLNKVGI